MQTHWLRLPPLRAAILPLLALCAGSTAVAQLAVPPELHGWEAWVLHDHPTHRCPWLVTGTAADDERICAWAGSLELQVDAHGGHFSQRWQAEADTWLPLPGNREYWPEAVTLDGKPAAPVMRDGAPVLRVTAGTATVAGVFRWGRRPEVLPLAAAVSLIDLTIDGVRVPAPQRTAAGVTLGAQTVARQDDHFELRVFRMLDDALPARLTTELRLTVAGEAREIRLPAVLPAGFVPIAVNGGLPARLDPDDTLHVQARPGNFTLVVEARGPSPVTEVRAGPRPAPWPAQEVWSFRAEEQLRTVSLEGVPPSDPAQADVPGRWRTFPAYRLDAHAVLHLVERTRGIPSQNDNALQLQRTAWLDFAGKSYTLVDTVSGEMRQGWRLDMAAPYVLQSAWTDAAEPLLITAGMTPGLTGVELRAPEVNLQTISQVRRVSAALPASGWHTRFTQVSGQLIVGPGYRLLAALGPDSAPQAWLERWRLLDIFGVLLVASVAWRLLGVRTALIALGALVLTYQESGAPTWLWLNILVALALLRAAPEGRLKRWTAVYRWLAVAALLVALVPFAISQARLALYPQLEALELLPPAVALSAPPVALSAPAVQTNIVPEERAREADRPHQFGGLAGKAPQSPAALAGAVSNAPVSAIAVQEVVVTGSRASSADEMRYEPGALVQAGPGVPAWKYHVYPYSWSGPVDANATARFVISPPWLTRLWRVLGLALSVLLLYELTRSALPALPAAWHSRANASVVLVLLALSALIGSPGPAHAATTPDPRLLSELQTRLLERPKCLPTCADISSAEVTIDGTRLTILLQVSALDRVGVPLPGTEPGWGPDLVQIDGAAAGGVYRDASGTRYVMLSAGHHVVRAEGPLGATEALSLAFPLSPRVIDVHTPGWDSGGVSERHLVSGALELARRRVAADAGASSARQEEFPPFVSVDRLFHLAHDWTIVTTVSRVAPRSAAFTVTLPLLANEAVTTPGLTARDGAITLGLGVGEPSQQFSSSLPPSETLELVAPTEGARTERWRFNVGVNWHVEFSGTPAVVPAEQAPLWLSEYYPRPGEHLTLRATRPAATPGGTLAFDEVQLQSSVGKRSSDSTLTLSYRSTQGGPQTLHLPADAHVIRVLSDGEPVGVRPEHGALALTALPGSHSWTIDWETPEGVRVVTHSPLATLAAPASNLHLSLRVPEDRWVLYTFGRGVGPTILYWGELVVFVVLAWLIGRSGLTPLATREWLLLGLGLSTFSWGVFGLFLLFVAALEWRARHSSPADRQRYNLMQVGLALLAVVAIGAVVAAVPQGLLARPDMRIMPASDSDALRWFVDQTASELPSPSVLSVSLWWYKLAMLGWALWLSFALTRWVRWAWQVFTRDGLWRSAPPAAPQPEVT